MDDIVRCDLSEFNQALSRINEAVVKVHALVDKVERGISETCISSGSQVITCKNVLLGGYLAALNRFAVERVMGSEELEAVVREAIKLRIVYEKANVLEKRLKHQIETALMMVVAEEAQTTVTPIQPAKAFDELFDEDEEEEEDEEDVEPSNPQVHGNPKKDADPTQFVGNKIQRTKPNTATNIPIHNDSSTREREREQYQALRKLSNNPVMQDLLAYYEDRPTEELAGNARLSMDQKLIDYEEEAGVRLSNRKRADLEKAARKQMALTNDLTEANILDGITKLGSIISGAKNTIEKEDGTQALIDAATRKANQDMKHAGREKKLKK
ncbi:hypothetical protein GMRT_13541 [Giardia muris]|uniref:Uncharacterized protein n=1 Tax=Giardia muris TaxID=5742 RepID=A0A4Z1TBR1_GIAMU|nr:hypothetical protein GMRT_13541 [Giardia muris]|eukprot:TNJ29961.1 hypothetical protein GMRT_13541 [Giardia muris]